MTLLTTVLYTLGTDGEEGDLQKSMVLEREGSICEAPGDGDTDDEQQDDTEGAQNERKDPEEADWTPVSLPDSLGNSDSPAVVATSVPPTPTGTMATSVDSLGSSSSDDLESITDSSVISFTASTDQTTNNTEIQTPTDSLLLLAKAGLENSPLPDDRTAHEEELTRVKADCDHRIAELQAQLDSTSSNMMDMERLTAENKVLKQELQAQAQASSGSQSNAEKTQQEEHAKEVAQLTEQLNKQHQEAMREKENEVNETFQRMLTENATSKQQLEASSAQLLEGKLHSMQVALDEQTQQLQRWQMESEQANGELALAQQALQQREKQLEAATQQVQELQQKLDQLPAGAGDAAPIPPPPVSPPPYIGSNGGAAIAPISASSTYIASPADLEAKISFTSFTSGDLALFLPVPVDTLGGDGVAGAAGEQKMAFLAFNHGCPHHYVAEECMQTLRQADNTMPSFFLGKVFMVDGHTCAEGGSNPYNLPFGTQYHTLLVEKFD